MIRAIPAICLIALLMLFAVWLGSRVEQEAAEMKGILEGAEEEARAEDWERARNSLRALDTVWHGVRPLYRVTLEQRVIDDAENAIRRLQAAAGNEDKDSFMVDAASLHGYLAALSRLEEFSWDAVF